MSEFAQDYDGHVAAEIARLGKTRDCRCWVRINPRIGMPPIVELVYRLTCPVHYPKTSALLVRSKRGAFR